MQKPFPPPPPPLLGSVFFFFFFQVSVFFFLLRPRLLALGAVVGGCGKSRKMPNAASDGEAGTESLRKVRNRRRGGAAMRSHLSV